MNKEVKLGDKIWYMRSNAAYEGEVVGIREEYAFHGFRGSSNPDKSIVKTLRVFTQGFKTISLRSDNESHKFGFSREDLLNKL